MVLSLIDGHKDTVHSELLASTAPRLGPSEEERRPNVYCEVFKGPIIFVW